MNSRQFSPSEPLSDTDREIDKALRPKGFEEFTGQKQTVDNLNVFVSAARQRNDAKADPPRDSGQQPIYSPAGTS